MFVLGTANFGLSYGINNNRLLKDKDIISILEKAKDHNISTLDTAQEYGNCEQRLGNIDVSSFLINSKISFIDKVKSNDKFSIEKKIYNSLNQLKVDKLNVLLIHNPDFLIFEDKYKIWEILQDLKKFGMFDKLGLSIYQPSDYKIDSYILPDLIQAPLNIFDGRILKNHINNNECELQIRSVFLQGLLMMDQRPKYFDKYNYLFRELKKFQLENNCTIHDICISYIYEKIKTGHINSSVIGFDDENQINDFFNYKNINTDELISKIQINDSGLIDPRNW